MSPSMPTREELRQIAEAVGPERKRGNGKDEQAETGWRKWKGRVRSDASCRRQSHFQSQHLIASRC